MLSVGQNILQHVKFLLDVCSLSCPIGQAATYGPQPLAKGNPWLGLTFASGLTGQLKGNPTMTDNTGWPSNAAPVENPAAETQAAFIERRDKEINTWLQLKDNAVRVVLAEKEARDIVTKTLFPTPKKGTQRYNLNAGYKMKLVYPLNYKLGDKDKTDESGEKISIEKQVQELEDKLTKLSPAAALLCDRLIKWKPELSGSEYEKLDASNPVELEVRNLIDEILTITPGSPQLEMEEPKS